LKVIAVGNQKGGVGKTTTAVSLGGLLARSGFRVLMVDLDPQASLNEYFVSDYNLAHQHSKPMNLFQGLELIISGHECPRVKPIAINKCKNLFFIPGDSRLIEWESVAKQKGLGLSLDKFIAKQKPYYDVVILDCPPNLGVLMINALAACDSLVIPCQSDFLALTGVERTLRTVSMVYRSLKKTINCSILPTLYDSRTHVSRDVVKHLKETYFDMVFSMAVPLDVQLKKASRDGIPASHYIKPGKGIVTYYQFYKYLQSISVMPVKPKSENTNV
jgi:chromosome partitioning protein